jgi:hypothetical protein
MAKLKGHAKKLADLVERPVKGIWQIGPRILAIAWDYTDVVCVGRT